MKHNTLFWNKSRRVSNAISLACLLLFLLGFSSARAYNVITSGTFLKGTAGTFLISSTAMDIKSGATLDHPGTLTLKDNLTNENGSPNSLGLGTVELSGTSSQTISGQNIIQNLTINNATGIIIGGNTWVNGILALTSGTVALAATTCGLGPLPPFQAHPRPRR